MSENSVEGRAWRFGTDIDTDVIVPSQYMRKDPEEYARHLMEPEDPEFADKVENGDVIVAETNFGIGSSREHAAIGLKIAGIDAVISVSFGRIFYRNAVNQGLPACERARTSSRVSSKATVSGSTSSRANSTVSTTTGPFSVNRLRGSFERSWRQVARTRTTATPDRVSNRCEGSGESRTRNVVPTATRNAWDTDG